MAFRVIASALLLLGSRLVLGQDLDWWKSAVFYQIYPRSFMDATNDGVGDLAGVTSKLDHLVEAGVTALWLSPIYRSPQVDHGYDISDYRDVDPIFGTLDDFKTLVAAAHDKGLKVVLDFVPNHSSDKHEWFEKSVARQDPYTNYYVWKDAKDGKEPNNWLSFFHGSAWKFHEKRGQYYLHQFAAGQPDLNYRDSKLVQEMKDVLTFWLNLGVDGFRCDIVPAIFEHPDFPDEPRSADPTAKPSEHRYLDHIHTQDQPGTYDMIYQWRRLLDDYQKEHGGDTRVMMTESYSSEDKVFKYYGNETHDGAHFTFNFWFITQLNKDSTARDIKFVIEKWLTYMPSKYTANWVLGNHDQHRVASRYGAKRVDGINMIVMLLPGVAVTYQGEEIGMENNWDISWEDMQDPQACNGDKEDRDRNSRDFQRSPFQWDDTVNAGFNKGHTPWLPVAANYEELNVKNDKAKRNSHFKVYQQLTKLKKTPTLKHGYLETLALSTNVFALRRRYQGHPTYLLLVNTADKDETVKLNYFPSLPSKLTVNVTSVESNRQVGSSVEGTTTITLTPYEAIILTY